MFHCDLPMVIYIANIDDYQGRSLWRCHDWQVSSYALSIF